MNRSVLILAPDFPPCSHAGVHRFRFLTSYLSQYGWNPIILTVTPDSYEHRIDWKLASKPDQSTIIHRVRALPIGWMRRFGLGDISLRCWWAFKQAASLLVLQYRPEVVFTSMLPTYHSLHAARLARRYRIPLVLDYQDPWITEEGRDRPLWSKAGVTRKLACVLEPSVLRWTQHVTAVSQGTWKQIQMRHPTLTDDHFSTLPIGGDPDDFKTDDPLPSEPPVPDQRGVRFHYVGTIWPQVMDTIRALFAAIAKIKNRSPAIYHSLHFHFCGTQSGLVQSMAESHGIGDAVSEIPQRIPYTDALQTMKTADVLMVLGSSRAHYSASKIFPSLMSRKPIFALIHEASEVTALAKLTGGVAMVNFDDESTVTDKIDEISAMIEAMVSDPVAFAGHADLSPIRDLFADEITKRFAQIFDRVADAGFGGANW